MNNLAHQMDSDEITHVAGIVVRAVGDRWNVRSSSGLYEASRAASCLLAPDVGDRVTLALEAAGGCYIVSILEREAERTARMSVSGDLQLDVEGRCGIAAQQGVELVSGEELRVVSGRVSVNAVEARGAFERLTYVSKFLQSKVEQVKTVASTFEIVAERLTQTAKRCYRFIGEFDQLRAERIDHQAHKTMRLHGQNAVVTAQQLVQVDGEQIHLG